MRAYYTQEALSFSLISGGGIYQWTGQTAPEPPGGSDSGPVVRNVHTGEEFLLKRTNCTAVRMRDYCRYLRLPPPDSCVLWPEDMITLTEEQQMRCGLFVEQFYAEKPASGRHGSVALLFPPCPPMQCMTDYLAGLRERNWKNEAVQKLIQGILQVMAQVNRAGYLYGDLSFSRFFLTSEGRVVLNFSNLIFSDLDRPGGSGVPLRKGAYPIEFADPTIVRGLRTEMDMESQNFSLTAMIFYLMFGVYPYDGRLMSGYPDDNPQQHAAKFRDYHRMPVFLFDPADSRNALGAFEEDQAVLNLWSECPEEIRTIFIRTLAQSNAERTQKIQNPSPEDWLRCFEELFGGSVKGGRS